MEMTFDKQQSVEFGMLVLVVGREARGDGFDSMRGVAWSIRNRVSRPGWWGRNWLEVITKRWQYSSINGMANDPNLLVYPDLTQGAWLLAVSAAAEAYASTGEDPTEGPVEDPTLGAVSYYDDSLDAAPPSWASEMIKTVDLGHLHFFRTT